MHEFRLVKVGLALQLLLRLDGPNQWLVWLSAAILVLHLRLQRDKGRWLEGAPPEGRAYEFLILLHVRVCDIPFLNVILNFLYVLAFSLILNGQ